VRRQPNEVEGPRVRQERHWVQRIFNHRILPKAVRQKRPPGFARRPWTFL